ncbi:MAG: hypothetical protein AAB495_03360 [Patescibacteria group bacterium]
MISRRKRNLYALLLCAACVAAVTPFFIQRADVFAAGPSLGISPASGSYGTGGTFTVKIMLQGSGGVGINAADGVLVFDKTLLSVQSVSKENSIFSLWTADPSFSNGAGTVSFSGGTPTPFTKESGAVMSVVFKAVAPGDASVELSEGSILAADGKGTNVLSSLGKATYTLGGLSANPKKAPEITGAGTAPAELKVETKGQFAPSTEIVSQSHPNADSWYSNKNPEFSWKLDPLIAGVSTALTEKAGSDPGRASEGLQETKRFNDVEDGIWYFHVRFKDQNGAWSAPMHRRVGIDTIAPLAFDLAVQKELSEEGYRLSFIAEDALSGIDHYEIRLDGKEIASLGVDVPTKGPYRMSALLSGKHAVTVRALDKAGNATESTKELVAEGIGTPKITNFPDTTKEHVPVVIQGIADSKATVLVMIDKEGKEFSRERVRATDDGGWVYGRQEGVPPGNYTITAKMLGAYGTESQTSESISIYVSRTPLVERFGLIAIIVLALAVAGLVSALWYERKIFIRSKSRALEEVKEIQAKTKAVFEALREEVEEKVKMLDEKPSTPEEAIDAIDTDRVVDSIREALDVSEDMISKEVEDVQKALE